MQRLVAWLVANPCASHAATIVRAAALLAALATCAPAVAAPRHHRPRARSVPVFIAGVGTVWISTRPARGRP